MKTPDANTLSFIGGLAVGIMFAAILSMLDGPRVTCIERWKYQRTIQDTLNTVRSGCDLPDK